MNYKTEQKINQRMDAVANAAKKMGVPVCVLLSLVSIVAVVATGRPDHLLTATMTAIMAVLLCEESSKEN